jgi:hypothetical protein
MATQLHPAESSKQGDKSTTEDKQHIQRHQCCRRIVGWHPVDHRKLELAQLFSRPCQGVQVVGAGLRQGWKRGWQRQSRAAELCMQLVATKGAQSHLDVEFVLVAVCGDLFATCCL